MIPERFKERMKSLLGEDYPDFIRELEEESPVRGFRLNKIKSALSEPTYGDCERLSYIDNGYILHSDERVGHTPEHHAGLVYMQDPGAMAAVAALEIDPDMRVLDLCSAPGGKSSQVAERLVGDGFILSNEIVPKRAKIVVSNFERLGVKNALVTSMDTAQIAELFPSYFDLTVTDAPCSGEGMFRKGDEAEEAWSEETVTACAERQREILDNAAKTIAPGGYLLYSTCTYSTEENEERVLEFLDTHPSFTLIPVREEVRLVTADGIAVGGREELRMCRRFYPHKSRGEGQFIALMRRKDDGERGTHAFREELTKPTKAEEAAVMRFFCESLTKIPEGRLYKSREGIVLIGHKCPIPPRSVFMSGVMLGEVRGDNFFPHHQFFSAYGGNFKLKEDLGDDPCRAARYIAGEEINSMCDGRGWVAITYLGAPLGGGKLSGGRIKNHYPKGLRERQ